MQSSIEAPDGTKGRSQSHRRFIVCNTVENSNTGVRRVLIHYRTDNRERAGQRRQNVARGFIWDAVERKVVT